MSIAPRLTKCLTCWKVWPGQPVRFGQIVNTASSGLTVGGAAGGALGGGLGFRSRLPLRRWITGATTRGITSPARVTITSSPSRASLRSRSSSLCRVAVLTVTPPTWTGSSIANGTMWPVRPTFQTIFWSIVVAVVGGNFQAIAHRGSRLATPSSRHSAAIVDLDDDAVDLEVELVPTLLPPLAARDHLARSSGGARCLR